MRQLIRICTLSLLLLMPFYQGVALAKGRISLDQAVEDVRKGHDGRVIRAETQELEGRPVYNIRLLKDNGRMERIRIDSDDGRRIRGRDRR